MGEPEGGGPPSREEIHAAMRAKIEEALGRVLQAYEHRPPDLDQADEDRLIQIMAKLQELGRHIDAIFEGFSEGAGETGQGRDLSTGNPASSQADNPPSSA